MGNTFSDKICYHKNWLAGQRELVAHAEEDLADRRLHLVASPGGGKRELGLEMIRRLDAPALVLSQTTAGCERWKACFCEEFLPEDEDRKKWVSRDAQTPAPIICITYQSLYSSMNIGRPFLKWMRNAGVKTLCLDEPHHLRNEWWKMLEKLVSQMPELVIVTLTETPPYDTSAVEWERYRVMCGEIDRELGIPELAQEKCLCPHQDYLYLCLPDEKETAQLRELREPGEEAYARLMEDPEFLAAVKTHLGLAVPEAYESFFLENPDYGLSLLCYLKAKKETIPAEFLGEAPPDVLPSMTVERMETLLTGFFGYDRDSYEGAGAYQERLEEELKEKKAVFRGKINLTRTADVRRVLNFGRRKLDALETIVRSELDSLGDDLHMMILTDHIKKEQMIHIGDPEKELKDVGSVPVFEALRRAQIEGLYMMVMTNTLMMIPGYLVPWFEEHTKLKWVSVKDTEYYRLQFAADSQTEAVRWMTMMFREGYANVLIGTPALFEDGWDCSCVNSLVLATKVGTYTVTNQMRGLAIRQDPEHPEKVTNIWHVAVADPDMRPDALRGFLRTTRGELRREPGAGDAIQDDGRISEDLEGVLRRLYTVQGLQEEPPAFVSGPERLIRGALPCTEEEIAEANRKMLARAKDRDRVRRCWEAAEKNRAAQAENREEVVVDQPVGFRPAYRKKVIQGLVLGCIGLVLVLTEYLALHLVRSWLGEWPALGITAVLTVLLLFWIRDRIRVLTGKLTPAGRMEGIARGVMEALQDAEEIRKEGVDCRAEKDAEGRWHLFLTGGRESEKKLYAECVTEFLGPVNAPHYLILEEQEDGKTDCYAVPSLFDQEKADANLFRRNMNEYMGDVILGFTHGERGRRLLKKARFADYARRDSQLVRRVSGTALSTSDKEK